MEKTTRRKWQSYQYSYLTIDFTNEEKIPLDRFRFDSIKLEVKTMVPEVAILNQLFTVEYTMKNISQQMFNGKLKVKSSTFFFMIGEPEQRIKLEPGATQKFELQLLPLKLGFHQVNQIEIYESQTVNNTRVKQEVIKESSNESIQVIAGGSPA